MGAYFDMIIHVLVIDQSITESKKESKKPIKSSSLRRPSKGPGHRGTIL